MQQQDSLSLISVSDLVVVLFRQKWAFLLIFVAVFSTAILHGLFAKKTYELTGTINVGKFQGDLLEEGEFVAQKLEDYSFIARAIKQAGITLGMPVTRLQKLIKCEVVNEVKKTKDVGLVQLNVRFKDKQKVVDIFTALTNQLVAEHEVLLAQAVAVLDDKESEYKVLQGQIEASIQADEELSRDNAIKSKGPTAPELLLLEHTISEKRVFRSMLTKDIHDTRLESRAVTESYNTKLAAAPELPDSHLKPKLMLNIIIGGAVAVMLATLGSLFLNLLQVDVLPKLRRT